MDTPKHKYYQNLAEEIIPKMKKRGIKCSYYPNSVAAIEAILEIIPNDASVSWGGSVTLEEIAIKVALYEENDNHSSRPLLDPAMAKSPEEKKEIYRKAFSADYYLMSSNAITLEGELVNMDGNGNRLAALVFGPDNVLVVAGMNKIVADEAEGFSRIANYCAPINVQRLLRKTPCARTGRCEDCYGKDSICSSKVVTRRSHIPNRIHVILIGEELGY